MAPNTRRSGTAVCQAMPIAEVAGEFAEISGFATVMFAITLVVSAGCADCMPIAVLAPVCMLVQFYQPVVLLQTPTAFFTGLLQGLAAGFVLLRFEALVEEGKLDDVLK